MRLTPILQLLRPSHYIKNVFVLMPVFFAGSADNVQSVLLSVVAFLAFCSMASCIYILNDLKDLEADKQHHIKRSRPLPAGTITSKTAKIYLLVCFVLSMCFGYFVSPSVVFLLISYFVLNIFYSYKLKHFPIVDITIISIGFVLRLFVGSVASGVFLSHWIVIMTFLLALFLAISKRRDDVLVFQQTGNKIRSSIEGYNVKFLDASISMLGAIIIVAYLMYVTSSAVVERLNSEWLYLTSLFVIVGILRYLYRTLALEDTGSPTRIALSDTFLQVVIILWITSFAWIIY